MYEKVNYILRYGRINSMLVSNCNGPNNKQENMSSQEWIKHYNKITHNFYDRLENSILEKGIKDPIIITSGDIKPKYFKNLPEYMKKDKNKIIACIGPGCSRLYFAHKYNLEIPVIILDFINMFEQFEKIESINHLLSKWTDKPKDIKLGSYYLSIRGNVGL